jgi:hypothetical protein
VAVLEKAITGKDLELATSAFREGQSDRLTNLLVAEVKKEWDALAKTKTKAQVNEKVVRLVRLIESLPGEAHKAADTLTLDLFARRAELAKAKGINFSGSDVVDAVIAHMAHGPKPLQATLARAHAELEANDLSSAFHAARRALPAAEVYDRFSPYLIAKVDEKKKAKDPAWVRREAIIDALDGDYIHWHYYEDETLPPLDTRWLDAAVRIKHLGLVNALGRPDHKAAQAFVEAEYDAVLKKSKKPDDLSDVITVMVRLEHPRATDALLASYERTIGKANAYTYWYHGLIPQLPKSALPKLEAVIPKLKDHALDQWVEAIQELRDKK